MTQREVPLGLLETFPDGELVGADADGTRVIVARSGDAVAVTSAKCPHLNLPLLKGPGRTVFADGVVQCPWHGSSFEVCSGKNLDWTAGFAGRSTPAWSHKLLAMGRKPRDLPTFPAEVRDGTVFVTIGS